MKYGGTVYYYVLNLQGDVVGLVDGSRNFAARYTYDPWGKVLTATGTLADVNPLRYRGYYYDSESGFYYLQSRYYDPAIGRFINADSYVSTDVDGLLSSNMFAYCENNPVTRVDPSGLTFWDVLDCLMAAISWSEYFECPSLYALGWAIIDTVSLLPVIPSVSYARRGVALASDSLNATKRLDNFAHATEYGVDTYRNLRKAIKGTGLQAHHIIEKRFAGILNVNTYDMFSVALTKEEHQLFTQRWRKAIPYNSDYSSLTKSQLWSAARKVYQDYPELMEAAKRTIYPKGVR